MNPYHLWNLAFPRLRGARASSPRRCWVPLLSVLALLVPGIACAVSLLPGGAAPDTSLDSWSFDNPAGWLSDRGYAPISYTNITSSDLGRNLALVMDSTNAAWLKYNTIETSGTNNLCVNQGSVTFWFAPSWTDTASGGTGPGQYSRFIEAGIYTTNASYGWWSIYLSPQGTNLIFAAQTNGSQAVFLSAPVTFGITNRWHMLALTYSSTNSAFYFDGQLVATGLAVTVWPGASVLTNGFCIGSDSTGVAQVHGLLDDFATYSYPLDSTAILNAYGALAVAYYGNPLNRANLASQSSYPSDAPTFNVISGSGGLLVLSNSACPSGGSVLITNETASVMPNLTVNLTFGIAGGTNGLLYDVFANALMGPTNATAYQWAWMGQGYPCEMYMLTNLPFYSSYIILGTPQDSDGDGLTDAYERLVSHTDPTNAYTAGDGIPDGWKVLWGINAQSGQGVASQDPDYDGLSNWQEYLWGSNPQHSEGLTVWVSSPAGVTGIP